MVGELYKAKTLDSHNIDKNYEYNLFNKIRD